MSADLEKARADQLAAGQAWSAALTAKTDAVRAVEAVHNPIIDRLRRALNDAKAATLAAESAVTPDHAWEGRRVFCEKRRYSSWGSAASTQRLDGVVFTYRPGIDLGTGHKWSSPSVGDPFVRLLKKDGSPGSKTIALNREDWKLASAAGEAS